MGPTQRERDKRPFTLTPQTICTRRGGGMWEGGTWRERTQTRGRCAISTSQAWDSNPQPSGRVAVVSEVFEGKDLAAFCQRSLSETLPTESNYGALSVVVMFLRNSVVSQFGFNKVPSNRIHSRKEKKEVIFCSVVGSQTLMTFSKQNELDCEKEKKARRGFETIGRPRS